ncbi:putative UPF0481 protein [Acorus calamus]|uniref:UPF0481 protein n=1 Tax=Acorus calamus TaxID=4465 RepID=A0AAV9F2C8_ACOCL|nr:putative UPF0481 protein [Acorus calamus]
MERYKLYAARRVQKQVPSLSFEGLIERFVKLNRMFRASYHHYLDSSDEALAWLMFLDGSFLLEYLQAFATNVLKDLARVPTGKISHVIDQTWKKSTHNVVLRDIVMLENQIPLFVLKELIELVYNEKSNEVFAAILSGFCRKLSPFHNAGDLTLGEEELLGREHLLELLYNVSVPKPFETNVTGEQSISHAKPKTSLNKISHSFTSFLNSPPVLCIRRAPKKLISLTKAPIRQIRGVQNISSSSNQNMNKTIGSTEKLSQWKKQLP